jgi:hypothetical protein
MTPGPLARRDQQMRFMFIIKSAAEPAAPAPALMEAMHAMATREIAAGRMIDDAGLMPLAMGARITNARGRVAVVDGPFAETKELVAGFWIWQVRSKEEAIEWAKRCPNPTGAEGELEIRQIFEAEDFGAEFTPELRQQEERLRAQVAARK